MMLRDVVNDKVGRERSRVSLSRDTARVSLNLCDDFCAQLARERHCLGFSIFATCFTLGYSFFTTILISP